jgi:two-component system sensor histidine kinase UhpB
MNMPIRVLLVEDDMVDRMACRRALVSAGGGRFVVCEADSGCVGLAMAVEGQPQCILLDYRLPDLTGLEFLARLADAFVGRRIPPVLMLTGADSAALASESIRRGARDYLFKDVEGAYLALLPAAVERMLREQRLLDERHRIEARFRTLIEQIHAISYVMAAAPPYRLQYISPRIGMLGHAPECWLADPDLHARCLLPGDREHVLAALAEGCAAGTPLRLEYRMQGSDGKVFWFRDQSDPILDENGGPRLRQGILVDITADKAANEALAASREELRRLGAHQESIKEEERQRIARELHDELGGLLTGIKAYVSVAAERSTAASGEADTLLHEAAELAQAAIDTMRRVITDLRPSVLDQLGIWAALEWYAGHVARRSGLGCRCTIDDEASVLVPEGELATMLFRVVQEALTNVERHAHARHVDVAVRRDGTALEVAVADDGRGPGAEVKADAWGIRGMRERARRFGGELAICVRQGGGTLLVLRVPWEEYNEHNDRSAAGR